MTEKRLSIAENMAWNSAGSLVYLVCQWLITVLVVRLSSGYDAAGVLALGMAVSNIFTPIGQYKIRAFQVSDVRGEYTAGQYVALRMVTMVFALVVMVAYGVTTCAATSLPAVFLYGLFSFGPIFVDVLHGVDQQRNRMDIIGKSFIARGVLSVVPFSVVLWLTNSLEYALAAMTVLTFAVIALYDIPQTRGLGVDLSPDFAKGPIISLLHICAPAVIALFFCTAVPAIPRQVLAAVYGDAALGAYASIASPVLIIQMGAQYIYAPLMGVFAQHIAEGNVRAFRALLAKVTAGIALVAAFGSVAFALFGEFAFSLVFGEEIVEYLYLLGPLVFCTAITAYIWFLGDLLIVLRDFKGNLAGYLVAFVVCMALVHPLLIAVGMNGASYAIILGFAAGLICFLARIRTGIQKGAIEG